MRQWTSDVLLLYVPQSNVTHTNTSAPVYDYHVLSEDAPDPVHKCICYYKATLTMSTQMCSGALKKWESTNTYGIYEMCRAQQVYQITCSELTVNSEYLTVSCLLYQTIPLIFLAGRRWTEGKERGGVWDLGLEGWMRSVRCGSLVGFLIWCNCSLWLFHHWLFIGCWVWNLIDISGRRCGAHLGL